MLGTHMYTMRVHAGEPVEAAGYAAWLSERRRAALGVSLRAKLVDELQEVVVDGVKLLGLAHAVLLAESGRLPRGEVRAKGGADLWRRSESRAEIRNAQLPRVRFENQGSICL